MSRDQPLPPRGQVGRSKCTVVSSLCQTGDAAESQGRDAGSSLNSDRVSLKDTVTPMSSKSDPANSNAH